MGGGHPRACQPAPVRLRLLALTALGVNSRVCERSRRISSLPPGASVRSFAALQDDMGAGAPPRCPPRSGGFRTSRRERWREEPRRSCASAAAAVSQRVAWTARPAGGAWFCAFPGDHCASCCGGWSQPSPAPRGACSGPLSTPPPPCPRRASWQFGITEARRDSPGRRDVSGMPAAIVWMWYQKPAPAPPPTKVLQAPHPSTTVNGTVAS